MADNCSSTSELCQNARPIASTAAKQAVREVFTLLGVDVDQPAQVEEFRKSLRFSDELRKMADKGKMAIATALFVAIAGAIWVGIRTKLGGG